MRNRILTFSITICLMVVAAALWIGLPWRSENNRTAPQTSLEETPGSSNLKRPRLAASPTSGSMDAEVAKTDSFPAETSQAEGQSALRKRLETIQNEPDTLERPGLLLDLMNDASLEQVQALLTASDETSNYPAAFRDEMKAAAYERWYHLDPAGALRAIDGATMSPRRKASVIATLLEDWSRRSPDQVSAFLLEGEMSGASPDKIYGAIVRGGALSGAVDLVQSSISRIQDPTLRSYALREAARAFQRDHAEVFEDWLGTLSTENQALAIAESAWIMAGENSDQALAGLKRLEDMEADNLSVTRARVLVKWAEKEPARAADWMVSQNVEGEEREMLFANLMNVWTRKDRAAAVAWAEALIAEGKVDEAFMDRVGERM